MYTILAADDDEDVRILLHAALAFEDDCNLVTMPSAIELLETASSIVPDLVILDVAMPSLNGIEAFALLRQVHWGQGVPVLFLTANPHMVARRMLDQRCAILEKPFELGDLHAAMRTLLSLRPVSQVQRALA